MPVNTVLEIQIETRLIETALTSNNVILHSKNGDDGKLTCGNRARPTAPT
jgi:hypothetical protein